MASRRLGKLSHRLVIPLVVAVLYLPFLNQAFHIDDRIYLETADHITRNPLNPYDYAPVFEGLVTPDAASHSHLPLMSYYLAAVKLVSPSQAEWVFHLAFLLFPLIAGFAFHDLASRFVGYPLAAALLLVSAPAFLTLGHTLMPDVALLAMWLWALSRYLRVVDGEATHWDRLTLIAAVLSAAFMSVESAGLLLLMGADRVLAPRAGARRASKYFWLALFGLPLLLWAGWYLKAYLHYDRFVLVHTLLHMEKRQTFDWTLLGTKFLSFLLNVGGVILCPVALWFGFAGRFRTRLALLVLLAALVPFYLWVEGWSGVQALWFALLLASGFLVLWEFLLRLADSDPRNRLLLLWFFGILASSLLLFYAGSVRYMLLALPPVILAWISRLERRTTNRYLLRNLIGAGVLLTLLYAVPVSLADYRFAGQYRDHARELVSQYGGGDHVVWFTGEWGFRYYLERAGAHLLVRAADSARPGDFIVKPFIASPWVTLYDGAPYTRLVEQRVVEEPFPLRVLDFSSHAGFYSTGWGMLPFSLSTGGKWEWFNVFEVQRNYDGVIPEAEKHY